MLIPLKLVRDQQLQQQIFDQLRDLIVSRRLLPHARMPSTRMMAEQFAISRMTVLLAYERLIAEGYLETRPAAGTFVAHAPCAMAGEEAAEVSELSLAHPATMPAPRSHPGSGSRLAPVAEPDVRVGAADPALFPTQRWRSLMRTELDRMGAHLGAEHPAGSPALREAVAGWLSTSRGLGVSSDQVLLVKGRQQAIFIAARVASHPCEGRRAMSRSLRQGASPHGQSREQCPADCRDEAGSGDRIRIVVEDPCDPDAADALAAEGAELVRVPVDAEGLRTNLLPPGDAAMVHVTPEHHRPLGAALSRDRRLALLRWAASAGALILEEDIDGEVRYGHMDVPPLMSLDRSERVMLIGGFSVSLGPWLDLAWLVLPRWLVPFAQAALRLIDGSRGGPEQAALAEFLSGGGYSRHLHRLTKAYASRRDTLLLSLRRHLDPAPLVWGQQAGLHVAWFPPSGLGLPSILTARARDCGLEAAALPAGTRGAQAVLLGFGHLPERQIESRVARLSGLMRQRAASGL
jgi:GntR family transcriptional regulator / MocR family aminotransferase